jgi:hypothetical protein
MRTEERPFEGWYYRQGRQAVGPVPTEHLKGLLAAGRLQPRQAVWRRGSDGLLFVHATTAAFGTTDLSCRPPSSPFAPAVRPRDRKESGHDPLQVPAVR